VGDEERRAEELATNMQLIHGSLQTRTKICSDKGTLNENYNTVIISSPGFFFANEIEAAAYYAYCGIVKS
jgi:hypothetical protein